MKRLSINEIKNDIKNGYGYMSYESSYYNGNLLIIHEPHSSSVIIHYERNGYEMTYAVDIETFLLMPRGGFNRLFNNHLFYGMTEIERT